MKKTTLLLTLSLSLLLSGCFNIFEDIQVNNDGSGTYSLKMDMSALISDEFMKGMLQQSIAENEATKGMADNLEMDTTIYMKDLPASAKNKTGNPAFWDRVQIQLKMSEKSSEFFTTIQLKFQSTDDIAFLYAHIDEVMAEGSGQATGGFNPNEFLPGGAALKFDKKTLTRLAVAPANPSEEADENMEMMKMMLGEASFTTTYHLPGIVYKVTIPEATFDQKKVTVKNSLLEMMEGKGRVEGQIRFK